MLLIIGQEPDFQKKTLIPTVINLNVSSFGFSILIYGMTTLQNQNGIFIYKSIILTLAGSSSPINPHIILQNSPSVYLSKITLYEIFLVFGRQIPPS